MEGGVAHLFSTTSQMREPPGLVHWRTSPDLLRWTPSGTVFPELPAWAAAAVPGAKGIWAPDISRVDGEFRLYYSVSTFGKNTSAIGLAVTKTLATSDPRFGWVDHGLVVRSERDRRLQRDRPGPAGRRAAAGTGSPSAASGPASS